VPDLSESIYSLFLHVKTPNHGLESSYENGLFIKFPQFCTQANIGDDIYLDMVPADLSNMDNSSFDTTAKVDTSDFCRHITQLNSDIQKETIHLDTILKDLRQYYASVKTKRQLGFDVPVGFRQDNDLQRQFRSHTLPRHLSLEESQSTSTDKVLLDTSLDSISLPLQLGSSITLELLPIIDHDSTVPSPEPLPIPLVRSVDKPSTSLPKHMSMSEDVLRACVGYQQINTLKKQFSHLYQDTVKLDQLPADAVLDSGCLASLRKKDRNTDPVPRPSKFGEVIHVDIVFGPEISVGNIHYGLLFVDRFSRMSYLYQLQNLTIY
jgi:hypothetical protein